MYLVVEDANLSRGECGQVQLVPGEPPYLTSYTCSCGPVLYWFLDPLSFMMGCWPRPAGSGTTGDVMLGIKPLDLWSLVHFAVGA